MLKNELGSGFNETFESFKIKHKQHTKTKVNDTDIANENIIKKKNLIEDKSIANNDIIDKNVLIEDKSIANNDIIDKNVLIEDKSIANNDIIDKNVLIEEKTIEDWYLTKSIELIRSEKEKAELQITGDILKILQARKIKKFNDLDYLSKFDIESIDYKYEINFDDIHLDLDCIKMQMDDLLNNIHMELQNIELPNIELPNIEFPKIEMPNFDFR